MRQKTITQADRNIAENLLTLRRRSQMTQKGFIEAYLTGENEKPIISISTLSNVEKGTQTNVKPLVKSISDKLDVDQSIFEMDPDAFAKNINLFFQPLLQNNEDQNGAVLIRSQSTVEKMVKILSDYLMDGLMSSELKPGDKLPTDRVLSATYEVPRSTVREALKVLSAMGLIQILPGQGTFIASEPTDFFLVPLSWTFLIGQQNTEHIIAVRNILEVESARLAAKEALDADLEALTREYGEMKEAYKTADFKSFLDLDVEFHMAIAKCSQNPIIHSLLHTSRKLLSYISKSGMVTVTHLDEIYKEHSAIYTAIVKKDPTLAAKSMSRHLARAHARYQL